MVVVGISLKDQMGLQGVLGNYEKGIDKFLSEFWDFMKIYTQNRI